MQIERKLSDGAMKERIAQYEIVIRDQNQKLSLLIEENDQLKARVAKLEKLIDPKTLKEHDDHENRIVNKILDSPLSPDPTLQDAFALDSPLPCSKDSPEWISQKQSSILNMLEMPELNLQTESPEKTPKGKKAKLKKLKLPIQESNTHEAIPLAVTGFDVKVENNEALNIIHGEVNSDIAAQNVATARIVKNFENCFTPAEKLKFFTQEAKPSSRFSKATSDLRLQANNSDPKHDLNKNANEYAQFLSRVQNANKTEKIKILFELCRPMEQAKVHDKWHNEYTDYKKRLSVNKFSSVTDLPEVLGKFSASPIKFKNQECEIEKIFSAEESITTVESGHPIPKKDQEFVYDTLTNFTDNLLLIGPEKASFKTFSSELDINLQNLYIRRQPVQKEVAQQIESIPKFVIPFGDRLRSVKIRNINGKVREAILKCYDKKELFSFSLNSEIADKSAHLFSKEYAEKHHPLELLKATNASCFAYFYCLKFEDFLIDLSNKKQTETDLFELHFCHKIFVVKTFYPFAKLFEEMLSKLFEQLKSLKVNALNQLNKDGKIDLLQLEKIDAAGQVAIETAYFASAMNSLSLLQITNKFQERLKIELPWGKSVEFMLPALNEAFYCEAETASGRVFQMLPSEEFIFILFSLMFEKSVIFVSERLQDISACICTFLSFLKPFQWQFPRIYSLPEDCLLMLNSPIPIVSGLNLSASNVINDVIPEYEGIVVGGDSSGFVWSLSSGFGSEQGDDEKWKTQTQKRPGTANTYVFLDEGVYYYDFDGFEGFDLPDFKEAIERFDKLYKTELNPRSSPWFKFQTKADRRNEMQLVSTGLSKMRERLIELENQAVEPFLSSNPLIERRPNSLPSQSKLDPRVINSLPFRFWRKNFIDCIVSGLKKSKVKGDGSRQSDYDYTQGFTSASDAKFIQRLWKTQAFTYFMEESLREPEKHKN